MGWGLWLAVAHALPLVVHDPEAVPAVEATARALWPDGGLEILAEPTAVVPRFELRDGTLYWITATGTGEREAPTPATAVLLCRTWSDDSASDALGWVPPPLELPDDPDPGPPVEEVPPRPPLLDVSFGLGGRHGAPERAAMPGLGVLVVGRRGPFFGQLHTASRLRHSRLRLADQELLPVWPPVDPYDEDRFGVGLSFGVGTPLRREPELQISPFLGVGAEVRTYTRARFGGSRDTSIETNLWSLGVQVPMGLEAVWRRVGLRGVSTLDLRTTGFGWTGTLAVMVHP